ncbi:homoserine kinase [Weizmannia acidilactici]|uniref:Homoserine kinase n=1 Tax=Weizmannia acidilactici TaxID=2607726 RepID=A0A5J4J839_9BACI|nr:homoserine kinase [Weizmannia acidilactici]GER71056.1 homoserine kinase [Weizmannia acidilactici]
MNRLTIRVPASTANLGPGFDSVGMALNRFLTLEVYDHDEWVFEQVSPLLPPLPADDDPFILKIARQTADLYHASLAPCRVVVDSEIPLARGLGSSASAVVAGIELANYAGNLGLSPQEKLDLASKIEGHPDNVAASLFGGLIVSAEHGDGRFEVVPFFDIMADLLLFIPDYELKTEDARKVLPEFYVRKEAVKGSAASNLFIAALIGGQYELAGKMMEQDRFHEPYRIKLIPEFMEIRQLAKSLGAYGTVISGAGPTIISLVPFGRAEAMAETLQAHFPHMSVEAAKIDHTGLVVEKFAAFNMLNH